MTEQPARRNLSRENARLRRRLADAEETLRAITGGEVDALVVKTKAGEQVFTLQGSDTVYRVVFDNISEGAVTLSSDGVVLYANRYFAHMVHHDLKRVVGASMFDFVDSDSRSLIKTLLGTESWRGEASLTSRDGTRVPVYIATRRMRLDRLVSICAVVTDLTQQKRDEHVIRTGGLIREIMEQSPNAVLVCDADGDVIYASRAANELFGMNPVGQHADRALSCVQIDGRPLCFADMLARQVYEGTSIVSKENGITLYLLMRCGRLEEDGATRGYVLSLTDVTELKHVEELKDEFIGMVSHEIRTPLTVIVGALATATSAGLTGEEVSELISDAAISADSLAAIVENLLELSRSQSRRLILQKQPTDLMGVALAVADKLKTKSAIHRIAVDLPPELPPVDVDPLRAERVIFNLVDNAIKYSPRGGDVRVFARREREHMLVGVADQGIGISDEDQERLFRKFERFGRLEGSSIQGVGLGLNVCRILVEAHGGRIWVESTPGQGSTFYFTIPLAK